MITAHALDVLRSLTGGRAGRLPRLLLVHKTAAHQLVDHKLADRSPDGQRLTITDRGRAVLDSLDG